MSNNWFEDSVAKMSIKELKDEKRKWERKNLSAMGRGEFFGVMIINSRLEAIDKRLNALSTTIKRED